MFKKARRPYPISALFIATTAVVPVSSAYSQGLEEIIITAERREASLQETPISIAAFSPADLERSNIQSSYDLQLHTPGLVMSSGLAQGQMFIRGIGSANLGIGADPSSSIHVDGVYRPRASAALTEFYDVERIEVLKGPQGTLYGRNTTGGTINIISKKPTDDLEGHADAMYGSHEKFRFRATTNVPFSGGAAARFSVIRAKSDGYSTNLSPTLDPVAPTPAEKYYHEDLAAIRGALRIDLGDSAEWNLVASGSRDRGSRSMPLFIVPGTPGPQVSAGAIVTGDHFRTRLTFTPREKNDEWSVSSTIDWELGAIAFKSLTSYAESKQDTFDDVDASEINSAFQRTTGNNEVFTQEFQIRSNSNEDLEWIVGAFYLTEDAVQSVDLFVFQDSPTPLGFLIDATAKTSALAGFGQASYNLIENLRLTAGLRYSWERKKHTTEALLGSTPGEPGAVVGPAIFERNSWNAWTPKFGIDFFATEDLMLYITASRGFKSGGYNSIQAPPVLESRFDPEKIWAYEAGLKGTFLNNHLRTNLAVFFYDYKDLQVTINDAGLSRIRNAASAEIKGLDLQVNALVSEQFQVDMSYAYLDATFKSFPNANDPDLPLIDGQPQSIDLSGSTLPHSPKHTLFLGAQYTVPLSQERGSITLRGEYSLRSKMYFTAINVRPSGERATHIFNASLTYEDASDRWRASIFGRNLTDVHYIQTVIKSPVNGTTGVPAAPRTWGIEIGHKF